MKYTERICLNIVINTFLFAILLTTILLAEFGIIPTSKSGFFCRDPHLSYPYYESDTVPSVVLCIVIVIVPFVTIFIIEICNGESGKYSVSKFVKDSQLVFLWYREYIIGMGLNTAITEISKFTIGKPRPSFFALCIPDGNINCTQNQYIEKFECTNSAMDFHTLLDASRSFLSGHASTSVFMGCFLFWYLQKRCGGPWLLQPILQFLCLFWGVFTSLSRIIDYRHHWWDVLAGAILGALCAAHYVFVGCRNFNTDLKGSSKIFSEAISKLKRSQKAVTRNSQENSLSHTIEMDHT